MADPSLIQLASSIGGRSIDVRDHKAGRSSVIGSISDGGEAQLDTARVGIVSYRIKLIGCTHETVPEVMRLWSRRRSLWDSDGDIGNLVVPLDRHLCVCFFYNRWSIKKSPRTTGQHFHINSNVSAKAT